MAATIMGVYIAELETVVVYTVQLKSKDQPEDKFSPVQMNGRHESLQSAINRCSRLDSQLYDSQIVEETIQRRVVRDSRK